MPATAGCPLGSRSERNADRRARSDNARPIKVRTPAPGFSTDSDAREEAGLRNGQPAPLSRAPAISEIRQHHQPPATPALHLAAPVPIFALARRPLRGHMAFQVLFRLWDFC